MVKSLHIRLFFLIESDRARVGVLIITFPVNPILSAEHSTHPKQVMDPELQFPRPFSLHHLSGLPLFAPDDSFVKVSSEEQYGVSEWRLASSGRETGIQLLSRSSDWPSVSYSKDP